MRTVVYRLYDEDGTLLYVGVSDFPDSRWSQHARDKEWWPEVARKTVEWLEDRETALGAERVAVRTENPRYNRIRYSPDPTPMVRINFDVPADLHRQLRMKVASEGTTIAEVGRRLLEEWLQR